MSSELVRPGVVLERFTTVTGSVVPPKFDAGSVIFHGLTGPKFDVPHVVLEHAAGGSYMAPEGQYDPAQDKWLFPNELVYPDEQPALRKHLTTELFPLARRTLLRPAIAAGALAFDIQHPRTRSTRQELAQLTGPLDPKSWLGRTGVAAQLQRPGESHVDGQLLGADDFTIAYPTLSPSLVVDGGRLTWQRNSFVEMVYSGVNVTHDVAGPGYSVRSTRTLTLAERDTADPTVWRPNWHVLSRSEWDVVRSAANVLEQANAEDPRFSTYFASIVHNQPN